MEAVTVKFESIKTNVDLESVVLSKEFRPFKPSFPELYEVCKETKDLRKSIGSIEKQMNLVLSTLFGISKKYEIEVETGSVLKNVEDLRNLSSQLAEKKDLITDITDNVCFVSNLSGLDKYTDEMENRVNVDLAAKEAKENDLNADRKQKTEALEEKFKEKEDTIENTNVIEENIDEVSDLEEVVVPEETVQDTLTDSVDNNEYVPFEVTSEDVVEEVGQTNSMYDNIELPQENIVPEVEQTEEAKQDYFENNILSQVNEQPQDLTKVVEERSAYISPEGKKELMQDGLKVLGQNNTLEDQVENAYVEAAPVNNEQSKVVNIEDYRSNEQFTDNIMNALNDYVDVLDEPTSLSV